MLGHLQNGHVPMQNSPYKDTVPTVSRFIHSPIIFSPPASSQHERGNVGKQPHVEGLLCGRGMGLASA